MRVSLAPFALLLAIIPTLPSLAEKVAAPTPVSVVNNAPASAWKAIADDQLLVMTLAGKRRVVIQLMPRFSQGHVANMKILAKAHWWDDTSVYRVQDNYVTQWGDRTEKKPVPPGMKQSLPQDYSIAYDKKLAVTALHSRDSYAPLTGFLDGWPVASDHEQLWLTHCYGMVGVGRNNAPDAGNGAELYTVIGQAPRQLDRNIALVGRVIEGMAHLSNLPRGTAEIGMYGPEQIAAPILSVRLASEMTEAERPKFEIMDTASKSFVDYIQVRSNRKDDFYIRPAGGVDVCNVPVPIRSRS